MPILTALRVEDGVWVPYASMILMELYEDTTKPLNQNTPAASRFYMRLIYNGKVLTPPFCKNGSLCGFQELSKYLYTVTPTDEFAKQCSLSRTKTRQTGQRWNF